MTTEALALVERFDPGDDGLARKSRELVLQMLEHSASPFSRHQFTPGHITCTALVLHPSEAKVLFMFHHRLKRWLLPGGHVEESDGSLVNAAAREAQEETMIELDPGSVPLLAGIDVHGIPPKTDEPFHLHHDLIWCLKARSPQISATSEAPAVQWAGQEDWHRLGIAESICNAIGRMQ